MNIDQELEGMGIPLEDARFESIVYEIRKLERRVKELEAKVEGGGIIGGYKW